MDTIRPDWPSCFTMQSTWLSVLWLWPCCFIHEVYMNLDLYSVYEWQSFLVSKPLHILCFGTLPLLDKVSLDPWIHHLFGLHTQIKQLLSKRVCCKPSLLVLQWCCTQNSGLTVTFETLELNVWPLVQSESGMHHAVRSLGRVVQPEAAPIKSPLHDLQILPPW